MIKYNLLLLGLLSGVLFASTCFSQIAPEKYWIQFTDKNNSPYSIFAPQDFLSNRAIQRRITQGISVVENDLPVNPDYVNSVITTGATVLHSVKWFNGVMIQTTDPSVLSAVMALPFVSGSKKIGTPLPSLANNASNKFPALGEKFLQTSHSVKNDVFQYGSAFEQIHMLNGQELHNQGYQGQGMIIAVIDAGFNNANILNAFDSLWQNNRILGTNDFVTPGQNIFDNTHNHGMNVLSIIAANLPGEIVGSAPASDYWLLRSEDGASEYPVEEYNWIVAAAFADSAGVDVINTSLGYSTFDDSTMSYVYANMDGNTTPSARGVDIASSKGMLVVVAAGNAGNNNWHFITTPGDADSALTCAAVDINGDYASFSSVGPSSDGDVKPNVSARGQGTAYIGSDGGVYNGNGTSFSSPLISGLAACLWQKFPAMTNMQIKSAIEQSSHLFSNPTYELGYGIPNFAAALNKLEFIASNSEGIIKVFPNPFTNTFDFEFYSTDSQTVTIEIINMLGFTVLKNRYNFDYTNCKRIQINNIKNLAKGTYILKATTKNKSYFSRVVKE